MDKWSVNFGINRSRFLASITGADYPNSIPNNCLKITALQRNWYGNPGRKLRRAKILSITEKARKEQNHILTGKQCQVFILPLACCFFLKIWSRSFLYPAPCAPPARMHPEYPRTGMCARWIPLDSACLRWSTPSPVCGPASFFLAGPLHKVQAPVIWRSTPVQFHA